MKSFSDKDTSSPVKYEGHVSCNCQAADYTSGTVEGGSIMDELLIDSGSVQLLGRIWEAPTGIGVLLNGCALDDWIAGWTHPAGIDRLTAS